MNSPLIIDDYDPAELFESLRARIAAALDGLPIRIEHVGSTAVPGLAAKPVIDMDVLLESGSDFPLAASRLASIGYQHQGELGVEGRNAFRAPPGSAPHHLYVCPDGREFQRHIIFRDHLRDHPVDARAYAGLKRRLAVLFRHDRAGYSATKTEFVRQILTRSWPKRGS